MTLPLLQKVTKNKTASWWKWEWKCWLKIQHSENRDHGNWFHHFWQVDGEIVESVADFIFLCSKITADGDCSHEIKRHLLLVRKVMTNLDNILKSRDIILLTKVHLVKAMVFPVVVYGCESWTIKKAEHWRIDAFELWYWRKDLTVPWTSWHFNQSILKESSPEYHWKDWCWNWNFNTLATWCKELIHWKRPWCWERLKSEGEGDDRG